LAHSSRPGKGGDGAYTRRKRAGTSGGDEVAEELDRSLAEDTLFRINDETILLEERKLLA
jgi:hypothetical protein